MRAILAFLFLAAVTGFRIRTKREDSAGVAVGSHTAGDEAGTDPIALVSRNTTSWEVAYNDRGTGSRKDLQVWRPIVWSGEYRIMYHASGSYGGISFPTIVVSDSPSALAKPTGFRCEWNDRSTGGDRDGSLWRPEAPSGYECLSDVAVFRGNSHNPGAWLSADAIDSSFRCVHNSLIKYTDLGGQLWNDGGSGGRYDGAVWSIQGSDGMRVNRGGNGYGRPPQRQPRLKVFTGGLYRGMELVLSVSNPQNYDQPDSSYSMSQGLTISRQWENSTHWEIGQEIGVSAEFGIAGIATGTMSYKITSTFGASTRFSHTETSQTVTKTTVNFRVPARTKVDLWQLIVKDSKHSAGTLKIKSAKYVIETTRI